MDLANQIKLNPPDTEEFNNFMYRVNEVDSIVKQLSSDDKKINELGKLRADLYLGDADKELMCDEDGEVVVKVQSNRTVINKQALRDMPKRDPDTMDPEVFKREISRDAQARFEDKKIRKEKAETFKVQGNKAFRRGEYERALSCYSRAIDQIKDNCLLYNNRILTLLRMKLYERAKPDCEWALKINEDNLKTWLYQAHVFYGLRDYESFESSIREAKTRHPNQKQFIDEYACKIKVEVHSKNEQNV